MFFLSRRLILYLYLWFIVEMVRLFAMSCAHGERKFNSQRVKNRRKC